MAESAVTFLLEQVKEVVVGYGKLIAGAEQEFHNLTEDLSSLKAHLKQISERENKEAPEIEIEMKMRDTVYEVEDAIDACLTKAMQTKGKNVVKRALVHLGDTSLAREISSIRKDKLQGLLIEARDIAAKRGGVESPPLAGPETPTPLRHEGKVVGFDGEEMIITSYLMEFRQELDVISILAIPGQGKTTLAWKVYHNETINLRFPIRIWISISQVFNSKDVFHQILKRFAPNLDTSNIKDNELADIVRACLKKKRFLMVLEDVWSVDAWEVIKEVLPADNGEGKVLITTRLGDVAMRSRVSHRLRFLNEEESWTLLQYEVFGNLDDCPNHLEDVGCLIAKKCDGVPLTIVVIGGILMDQYKRYPSKAESEWKLVANSVSEALTDESTKKLITDVVELSYNRLSDELKECLVYLAVFPGNYEISAEMLCRLWISEGFVWAQPGRDLKECAQENMMNLIGKNLLKAESINHMGEVKTCRVNEIVRAFCISISKEVNLFEEIKRSHAGTLTPSPAQVKYSRRLCFRSDLSEFLSGRPSGDHVRSFLCFYERPYELEKKFTSTIPESFRMLRILESKCIQFEAFPAKITRLVHLRYLTLFIKVLPVLPKPITELWNLQSLVVETTSHSITMKANIWTMVRLLHLKTRAAILLDNKWEGEAGQNLHTLSRLAPESCTQVVAKKAKNLKNLGIQGKLGDIFETEFLTKLPILEKLKMRDVNEQTSHVVVHSLPRQNCFPPNLKRLTLTNTYLEWNCMSTLAQIKKLEVLKLKDNAFVGAYWKATEDSFHHLQLLLIIDADLVVWEASSQSFPSLKFLVLKRCENLVEIPEAITGNLAKLEIERLQESAIESARTIIELKRQERERENAPSFMFTVGPRTY